MFWFPFSYSLIPNILNIHVSFFKSQQRHTHKKKKNIWIFDHSYYLNILYIQIQNSFTYELDALPKPRDFLITMLMEQILDCTYYASCINYFNNTCQEQQERRLVSSSTHFKNLLLITPLFSLSCSSHADVLKSPKCQAYHLKHFLFGQLLPWISAPQKPHSCDLESSRTINGMVF